VGASSNADWLTGVSTAVLAGAAIGAGVFAALAFTKQREAVEKQAEELQMLKRADQDRRDEVQRAQADLVTAWLAGREKYNEGSWAMKVIVRNGSHLIIRGVEVGRMAIRSPSAHSPSGPLPMSDQLSNREGPVASPHGPADPRQRPPLLSNSPTHRPTRSSTIPAGSSPLRPHQDVPVTGGVKRHCHRSLGISRTP
jgi:hypothetical protein